MKKFLAQLLALFTITSVGAPEYDHKKAIEGLVVGVVCAVVGLLVIGVYIMFT